MGKKLNVRNPSGGNVYGVLFNTEGQVYDTTTGSLTDYDGNNFGDYQIPFDTKTNSTSFYDTEFPDQLGNGKYMMSVFNGAGASETGDTHLEDMEVSWDGEQIENPISDLYHAEINYNTDSSNGKDEYTVSWFKNGVRLENGISNNKLSGIKREDGGDLFSDGEKDLEQIGDDTGHFKVDVEDNTDKISTGEAVVIKARATIGGTERRFTRLVSRDG